MCVGVMMSVAHCWGGSSPVSGLLDASLLPSLALIFGSFLRVGSFCCDTPFVLPVLLVRYGPLVAQCPFFPLREFSFPLLIIFGAFSLPPPRLPRLPCRYVDTMFCSFLLSIICDQRCCLSKLNSQSVVLCFLLFSPPLRSLLPATPPPCGSIDHRVSPLHFC